jgi:hypothetical protein
MESDKQLIGAAGEHLVLSRLLSKGMLAAQAPRGVRKVDILVNRLDDSAPSLIQVKSRSDKKTGGWLMNKKHEEIEDSDIYFCFVDFGQEQPCVYVIPGIEVAKVIRLNHSEWLATPAKSGSKHNDTDMRIIKNTEGWMDKYLEKWDLIC